MALHVALRHVTAYRYDRTVAMGPQIVRLRPAPHSRTPILAYSLRVHPAGHFLNWQQDPLGNYLARIVIPERTREFRLLVDLVAVLPFLLTLFSPEDFKVLLIFRLIRFFKLARYSPGMRSVVLHGPACDRVLADGSALVRIVFGCPTITPG